MSSSNFSAELQKYVTTHDLEAKVNTILNRALRDRPKDPYAVLSRLTKLEAPSLRGIIGIDARVGFDAACRPAIEVEIKTARGTCLGTISTGNARPLQLSDPRISKEKSEDDDEDGEDDDDDDTVSQEADTGPKTGSSKKQEVSEEDLALEQVELFLREGLDEAVTFVQDVIAPMLFQQDPTDQHAIDKKLQSALDTRKAELNAALEQQHDELEMTEQEEEAADLRCTLQCLALRNAVLATSIAVCRGGATRKEIPLYKHLADLAEQTEQTFVLPLPVISMLNGGSHALNDLPLQDIQVMPTGARTFAEAVEFGVRVQEAMQVLAPQNMQRTRCGGGLTPFWLSRADEALEFVTQCIARAQFKKNKCRIGVDVAACNFYRLGEPDPMVPDDDPVARAFYDLGYKSRGKNTPPKTPFGGQAPPAADAADRDAASAAAAMALEQQPLQLAATFRAWIEKFNIALFTDPFTHDAVPAMEHWLAFCRESGKETLIAAHRLLKVPKSAIPEALHAGRYNTVAFELKQYTTVTAAMGAYHAQEAASCTVIVHTSPGDVVDDFIADFMVALRCGLVKISGLIGAPQTVKLQRFIAIERELTKTDNCTFTGKNFRAYV